MKVKCIQAVAQAIGRALSEAEIRDIEDRLTTSLRELSLRDPEGTAAKPIHERLQDAAKQAGDQLIASKMLRQYRESLQVLAESRLRQHFSEQAKMGVSEADAYDRFLDFNAKTVGSSHSIDTDARAIQTDSMRQMVDALELAAPEWFGMVANREGAAQLTYELHGEDSGNPVAKKGAEQVHKIFDALAERFNRNGGAIARREDYAMPHHHSQRRVFAAGEDQWIADLTTPGFTRPGKAAIVKRNNFRNANGTLMNDAQLKEFLKGEFKGITTGGAVVFDASNRQGVGLVANRHSESRNIHFNDAEDYLAYQAKYGEKPLFDVLVGHVLSLSREIALVEAMGPFPDRLHRATLDSMATTAIGANPRAKDKINQRMQALDQLYNEVGGKTAPIASERWARRFDTLRNWLSATRLGTAVISSFPDTATTHLTAKLNNLPQLRLAANEAAALNPTNKIEERMARRQGLGLDVLIHSLNRYGQDAYGASFSRNLANATMQLSGMNAWTSGLQRAYGVTTMHATGAVVRDHATLKDLAPEDHRLLLSKGISETDYAVWRKAELEDWQNGNDHMLTPEAIYSIPDEALKGMGNPVVLREQAATRLLGMTLEETGMAVVNPGARERVQMGSQEPRGRWKGELMRSFFQFKAFPLSMIERHWRRGMSLPNGSGRAAYIAGLMATTSVLGMLSLQVGEVLWGRDPRKVFGEGAAKTWLAAFLKGGSLGLYGDVLLSGKASGESLLGYVAGPLTGLFKDTYDLSAANLIEMMHGQRTNVGSEAVQYFRKYAPFSTLWYTKAAMDHLIYNQLLEYFSPGYISRMRNKSERKFNQDSWWEPDQAVPERAPDLAAIQGD